MRRRRAACVAAVAAVMAAQAAITAPASAAVREWWVAAVPTTWNLVPNQRDAIHGRDVSPADTVFPTIVYRRYTRGWKRPMRNVASGGGSQDLVPGPLLRARVGDRLEVHFKNLDTLTGASHSMHFHGVHYKPSSDGSYLPGFSGRDGDVRPGKTWTYRLTAGADSAGVWPYHDHSRDMERSIEGGMYGMLSIRRRGEPLPDREFQVVFAAKGPFQTINQRAFVGNTPVYKARPGELVQWDVLAMGSEHHTFHVHGHRWLDADGVPEDTRTIGPAESFRIRWRERDPGTWLYHCHVEGHMAAGMIGIYQVRR